MVEQVASGATRLVMEKWAQSWLHFFHGDMTPQEEGAVPAHAAVGRRRAGLAGATHDVRRAHRHMS